MTRRISVLRDGGAVEYETNLNQPAPTCPRCLRDETPG